MRDLKIGLTDLINIICGRNTEDLVLARPSYVGLRELVSFIHYEVKQISTGNVYKISFAPYGTGDDKYIAAYRSYTSELMTEIKYDKPKPEKRYLSVITKGDDKSPVVSNTGVAVMAGDILIEGVQSIDIDMIERNSIVTATIKVCLGGVNNLKNTDGE